VSFTSSPMTVFATSIFVSTVTPVQGSTFQVTFAVVRGRMVSINCGLTLSLNEGELSLLWAETLTVIGSLSVW
jgi:hypothetical protein